MSLPDAPTGLRFFPFTPHPDGYGCEAPSCTNAAAWWEGTTNTFLCDVCADALARSSSAPASSLLEQYQQVMLAASDLIVRHTSECATCTRLLPLLSLRTASLVVAECVAKSDAVAWAVHDRLVSLDALAELAEVHLRGRKR